MKRYWKYVKPYLYAFILGPILMITEVVGEDVSYTHLRMRFSIWLCSVL